MKKFYTVLVVSVAALSILIFFFEFSWLPDKPLPYLLDEESCPFCTPEMYNKQLVFEGDRVMVLLNHRPMAEGHILIMPKRHVERFEDLSPEEFGEILAIISKMQKAFKRAYGKPDYVLIVQNGYYGGQTVNHTHVHMLPRGKESTMMKKAELWYQALSDQIQGRELMSEEQLKEGAREIQKAMVDEKDEN